MQDVEEFNTAKTQQNNPYRLLNVVQITDNVLANIVFLFNVVIFGSLSCVITVPLWWGLLDGGSICSSFTSFSSLRSSERCWDIKSMA